MAEDAPSEKFKGVGGLTTSFPELKMEASIAQSSKVGGESNSKDNIHEDNPEEEIWADDSDNHSYSESNLSREWNWRHNQFHTMGYREGITEGKEASAQEGFNFGFKQSVRVGKKWGLVRGITSAISCLPESSIEKLIPNIANKGRMKEIQKAVQAISSDDALRIYHESIRKSDFLRSIDCGDHSEEIFRLKMDSNSSSNELETRYKELLEVLCDSPDIKVGEELAIGDMIK